MLAKGPGGALVDDGLAGDAQVVGEPLLPRMQNARRGDELRADRFALGEAHEHVILPARRDDRARPRSGRALGGEDLRNHAALREGRRGAARHALERGVARRRLGDEFGVGILSGILRVETALIGEDHEHVRFDEVRHEGAERVVVPHLDFARRDRVVFIDDRNDAEAKELDEGHAGVEILLAVREVGVGEEHLRGADAVLAEVPLVGLHEPHLAHGRGRLQFVEAPRSLFPAEPQHPFGDGPRTHQDDFLAHLLERGDLARPTGERRVVEAAAVVRDERAADLHHDAACGC